MIPICFMLKVDVMWQMMDKECRIGLKKCIGVHWAAGRVVYDSGRMIEGGFGCPLRITRWLSLLGVEE